MTDKEIVIAAAEAMGWEPEPFPCAAFANARTYGGKLTVWNDTFHIEQFEGWNPLTSISDAWMLVEALVAKDWQPTLAIRQFATYPEDRYVFHGVRLQDGKRIESFSAHAPSAPRAITLAALKAIGGGKA